MRSTPISIVTCSYPGCVILPRTVAPSANGTSSATRNHAPNSRTSVSARQTRDLGARKRIRFSIRSVLAIVGNLLVASIPRVPIDATGGLPKETFPSREVAAPPSTGPITVESTQHLAGREGPHAVVVFVDERFAQ